MDSAKALTDLGICINPLDLEKHSARGATVARLAGMAERECHYDRKHAVWTYLNNAVEAAGHSLNEVEVTSQLCSWLKEQGKENYL